MIQTIFLHINMLESKDLKSNKLNIFILFSLENMFL